MTYQTVKPKWNPITKRYEVRFTKANGKRTTRRFLRSELPTAKYLCQKINAGKNQDVYDKTRFESIINRWFESEVSKMSGNTRDNIEAAIRDYIKPQLGRVKIEDLSLIGLEDFQSFLRSVKSNRSKQKDGKLSPQTINWITSRVTQCTLWAYKRRLIPHYPFMGFEKLKVVKRSPDFWSKEECHKFIAILLDTKRKYFARDSDADFHCRNLFWTAIYTGLRRGELMGLRRKDIDFSSNTITVRRQFNVNQKEYDAPPKGRSERVVPFPNQLKDILDGYKFLTHEALVFPVGSPQCINKFKTKFCPSHGLRPIKLHELRHTYTTAMAGQKIDSRYIQKFLGHSKLEETEKYTHLVANASHDLVRVLEIYGQHSGQHTQ